MLKLNGHASTGFTPGSNRSSERSFEWIYDPSFEGNGSWIGVAMGVCLLQIWSGHAGRSCISPIVNRAWGVQGLWASETSFKMCRSVTSWLSFDGKWPRTEWAVKVIPGHLRLGWEAVEFFTELGFRSFYSWWIVPRFHIQSGRNLFRVF